MRWVVATLILAVGLLLVWYFARLILYLVIGGVLAYALRPLVDRVQAFGPGRIMAILVTFVVVIGAVSLLLTYLVPFVGTQVTELSQQISPERMSSVASSIENRISRVVPIQPGTITDGLTRALETLFQEERLTRMMGSVVDLFTNLFYALIVIPFITFFFLKDGARIRKGLFRVVPNRYFEITLNIAEKVETNIGRYLQALLLQCISIATVASVLLWLVGLDYALAVGVFTGLANTIPYFGPAMGFLAGVLVGIAQTGDFSLVLGVLFAMGVTQVADNVLFQPYLFSRAGHTHPLLILFVVLIGAQLGGIIGMLVAIPITTTVRVIIQQIYWSIRNYRILKLA